VNASTRQQNIPTPEEMASNLIAGLRGLTFNERAELNAYNALTRGQQGQDGYYSGGNYVGE
jgi:hypothetical protein